MSDVSKTSELITEALDAYDVAVGDGDFRDWYEVGQYVPRLCTALEARQVDAREYLHAKCDCVPDLGPAHCHLCTGKGAPVKWEDCEAVREIADAPEPVDVVLTTADIEKLAHLLVQLSPATQRNSGATVRRLMQEMNIKEVSK